MHDGLHQETLSVDEQMAFLAFDLLTGVKAWRIKIPLFRRF